MNRQRRKRWPYGLATVLAAMAAGATGAMVWGKMSPAAAQPGVDTSTDGGAPLDGGGDLDASVLPDSGPRDPAPFEQSSSGATSGGQADPAHLGCDRVEAHLQNYEPVDVLAPLGVVATPHKQTINGLLVHFHGSRAALGELDRADTGLPLVGVDLGFGKYDDTFVDPAALPAVLASAKSKLDSAANPLVLGSWSNGYAAVQRILQQDSSKVNALILLDSLYGSKDKRERVRQLEPFTDFARRAAKGEAFLFLSHSQVETYDYATVKESIDSVLDELRVDMESCAAPALSGREPTRCLQKAGLIVVGYAGNDKPAHCRQMALYPFAISKWQNWL